VSIEATAWALRCRPGDGRVTEQVGDGKRVLGVPEPNRKLVLLVLAGHANRQNKAWPSQATIAREACLSLRSTQRAVTSLLEDGWVGRVRRGNRSSVYVLMLGRHPDP
jgi:hypothetical protein